MKKTLKADLCFAGALFIGILVIPITVRTIMNGLNMPFWSFDVYYYMNGIVPYICIALALLHVIITRRISGLFVFSEIIFLLLGGIYTEFYSRPQDPLGDNLIDGIINGMFLMYIPAATFLLQAFGMLIVKLVKWVKEQWNGFDQEEVNCSCERNGWKKTLKADLCFVAAAFVVTLVIPVAVNTAAICFNLPYGPHDVDDYMIVFGFWICIALALLHVVITRRISELFYVCEIIFLILGGIYTQFYRNPIPNDSYTISENLKYGLITATFMMFIPAATFLLQALVLLMMGQVERRKLKKYQAGS